MKIRSFLFIILAAGIISCRQQAPQAESIQENAVVATEETVTLTPEQVQRARLVFGSIEEVELSHDVNAPGRLDLPNDQVADVGSPMNGYVSQIYVHIGDHVAKGKALCRLVHPDIIKIQGDYIKAKLDLGLATTEYERQQVLNKEKVSAEKVFQESERNYRAAKANFETLKMTVKLAGFDLSELDKGEITDYLDVRSPIKGIVDKMNVNLGVLAEPDFKIFSIVCKEHMHIEVMVFEKDIPYVQVGQRVTFVLSNFSDQIYESHIFSIGSTLDKDSRSIPVYAEFENIPENIYPGMFLSATLHTGEGDFDALPESAIISEQQDEHYIFFTTDDPARNSNLTFRKAGVITGLAEDGYVQVTLDGQLPEGSKIVTEGGYYLRAEMLRSLE